MGCWNQTCGISNLAIRCGDPVVLFLLEPTGEELGKGGFCYSDDMFVPAMLPIFGEYNDYGGIENVVEDGATALILAEFKKRLGRTNSRTWIEEDKYEKDDIDNIESFINIIERGRLWMKDFSNNNNRWGFVMFHRHIYQSMIDQVSNRIPYNQEKTYGGLTLTKYLDMIEKRKSDPDAWFDRDNFRALTNSMSSLNPSLLDEALTYYTSNELAEIAVDCIMMREVMSLLRKAWIPQCGQGSQHSEYALHKALAVSVGEHVQNIIKEYEEENYVSEDELADFGEETIFFH